VRCYGEHVREHIGNLMGTHWELKGDIVGTNGEPQIIFKKILPHPP